MNDSLSIKYTKAFIAIWALLQIPRLIAVPLIQNVLAGIDPPMWMIPALGDIVIAVSAPLVIWGMWRKQSWGVWLFSIVWLALSIYDHATTVVTFTLMGEPPSIFKSFGSGSEGMLAPITQGVIDAVGIMLLVRSKVRQYFLGH